MAEQRALQVAEMNKEVEQMPANGRDLLQKGETAEAMTCFREALKKLELLQKKVKAASSTQSKNFEGICVKICNVCNILAVNLLKAGEVEDARAMLEKSMMLAENNDRGKAMTHNNLACYHKKIGKPILALIHLEDALDIEQHQEDSESKAETHLNTCAVLSALEKHDLAMQHAYQAIMIIQTQLLIDFLPMREKKNIQQDYDLQKEFKDRLAVLCISYHNLGVEQEYMKQFPDAVQSYRIAHQFALKYLGQEDGMTQNLKKVYEHAKSQIEIQEQNLKEKEAAQRRNLAKNQVTAGNKQMKGKPGTRKGKPPRTDIVANQHMQNVRIQKLAKARKGLRSRGDSPVQQMQADNRQYVQNAKDNFMNFVDSRVPNDAQRRELLESSPARVMSARMRVGRQPSYVEMASPDQQKFADLAARHSEMRRSATGMPAWTNASNMPIQQREMRRNMSGYCSRDATFPMRKIQTQLQIVENQRSFRNPNSPFASSMRQLNRFNQTTAAYLPDVDGKGSPGRSIRQNSLLSKYSGGPTNILNQNQQINQGMMATGDSGGMAEGMILAQNRSSTFGN